MTGTDALDVEIIGDQNVIGWDVRLFKGKALRRQDPGEIEDVAVSQRGFHAGHQRSDQRGIFRNLHIQRLFQQLIHHQPLPFGTAGIVERTIDRRRHADPGIGHRLDPVEGLKTRFLDIIQLCPAFFVHRSDMGIGVANLGVGQLRLDPADHIDDIRHADKVHRRIIADIQIKGLIQGLDRQLRPAEAVGRVDLLIAVAIDSHQAVPQDGYQLDIVVHRVHGDDHDRIGKAAKAIVAGVDPKKGNTGDPLRHVHLHDAQIFVVLADFRLVILHGVGQPQRADPRQHRQQNKKSHRNNTGPEPAVPQKKSFDCGKNPLTFFFQNVTSPFFSCSILYTISFKKERPAVKFNENSSIARSGAV